MTMASDRVQALLKWTHDNEIWIHPSLCIRDNAQLGMHVVASHSISLTTGQYFATIDVQLLTLRPFSCDYPQVSCTFNSFFSICRLYTFSCRPNGSGRPSCTHLCPVYRTVSNCFPLSSPSIPTNAKHSLKSTQSLWYGYLQSLPPVGSVHPALFWRVGGSEDEREAEEWIAGTQVQREVYRKGDQRMLVRLVHFIEYGLLMR